MEAECSNDSMEFVTDRFSTIQAGDIEDLIDDEAVDDIQDDASMYRRLDQPVPTMFTRREPDAPIEEPDYLNPRPARMADENGVQPGDALPKPNPMRKKRKGIRSRCWIFTYNNYGELPRLLPMMRWMRYGQEVGVEMNTPHLQGCVQFKNPIEKPSLMKYMGEQVDWMFGAYWERMKGSIQANLDYTGKDATFENGLLHEFGERPISNADARAKGVNASKEKFAQMLVDAAEGKLEKIKAEFPGEFLRMYRTLHAVRDKHCNLGYKDIQAWSNTPNLWVVGGTGTGKSSACWKIWTDRIYRKDCDKWFDGYPFDLDEVIMLMDDFEPSWAGKAKLKVWADRYPFRAQVKGTSLMIRPTKVVVTSNYRIEESDFAEKDVAPMLRRFKQISASELKQMYPCVNFNN